MDACEATIHYDPKKLGRAARTLFTRPWRPFLPWLLPSALVILAVAAVTSIQYPELRLVGIVCACLIALNVAWWPYAYHRYHRRFVTFWRGAALMRVTSEGISIYLDHCQSTLQWSLVKEVSEDSNSLCLFVSRGQAVVIPTDELPESVLRTIKEFLRQRFSS